MVRVLSFLKRISIPLKAIEYIVAFLVIGSALIAVIEAFSDGPVIDSALSFRVLIEQYNVVAVLFAAMAAVALADIISLVSIPEKEKRYRKVATFTFATGFFFLGILSLLTLGFNHFLWLNDLGLAAISATLYLALKANDTDEYI
jgi:hypothetical protein